ncbi:MAG TPA: response regulator [Terracidiphilus sp.]|nr:response regulator [Terracidiphilus sp.]
MRALIVDDSRFVRGFLRGMLEERGFACDEAADGRAALELLHGDLTFQLALVDWNMPVMNGLEMLRQLRADGFRDLKVMMVTTEAENDYIVRALEAGADEYLMKPFDDRALDEKLAMLGLVDA